VSRGNFRDEMMRIRNDLEFCIFLLVFGLSLAFEALL